MENNKALAGGRFVLFRAVQMLRIEHASHLVAGKARRGSAMENRPRLRPARFRADCSVPLDA